ncbi:MFS family permease [Sphingomonas jejuensis]|uniref:MFS family permease n=1 Tax=Sphingomonas jejuensis TaxID=904715 RepID=A0ABX0XJT4_9SPHN|nr:MFS family permease [Sphingomonas jejuensis]
MTAATPHPFTIPNFRNFFVARLCSMMGGYGMVLIIGWQAYNLARADGLSIEAAAVRLGFIGLFQFVPLFLLTPLVGWVADSMDRRFVVRAVQALQFAVALALAIATMNDAVTLPFIYGVAVLLGVARAFQGPAVGALAPNLVPKEVLPTAIALSSIAWQGGSIVGPAIAGPLYATAPSLPYWVASAFYAAAFLLFMRIGPVPRSQIDKGRGPIAQVVDGVRYVMANKLVLGVITLDLFAVLLAGAVALIPVYARDILQAGEHGLSLLAASPAIGAAAVALLFSVRPLKRNVGNRMLASVFVFGLATIGFGLSRSLPLSMLCLIIYGGADMFSVFVRQSLIQLHTPDDRRGRVGAVSQLTISASNELGEAESGFLAGLLGPVTAVVAGGIGAIVVTALWAWRFPQISAARTFDPSDEVVASEPNAIAKP